MGSRRLQYEVLVLNTTNNPTPNNNQQPTFETRVQKFRYNRENLRLFWIPDGFHPILVPRKDLHAAHHQQQQQQPCNDETTSRLPSSMPSLSPSSSSNNNNNGPASDRKQRRRGGRLLGGTPVEKVCNVRPAKPIDLYYRQKRKESANGDLSSETVMNMWNNETEEVKRKYNRLAVKQQIDSTLRHNPRISPRRVPLKSHSNNILEPTACYDGQHQPIDLSFEFPSVKQQACDFNAAISYAFGNNHHGGNGVTFNSANGSLTQGRDMKENYNSRFYHDEFSSTEESEEDSDDAFFARPSQRHHHRASRDSADDSDDTYSPISSTKSSPGLSATRDENMAADDGAEFSLL